MIHDAGVEAVKRALVYNRITGVTIKAEFQRGVKHNTSNFDRHGL